MELNENKRENEKQEGEREKKNKLIVGYTETQKIYHARIRTNTCTSSVTYRFESLTSYLIQVIMMTKPVKSDHLARGTLEYNNMEQAYHQHYYAHHQ